MGQIPAKTIADAMELISWPVDEEWIDFLTVDVYRPRWKRLLDDTNPFVRLRGAHSFGSSLRVTITTLGMCIGHGYGYFWREPRGGYVMTRASIEQQYLCLSFESRGWPPGGAPAEVRIPVVAELADDLASLIPTLETLADPSKQQ